MPKAKPVSLYGLNFDDALRKLIATPPSPKAATAKPKKKRAKTR